MDSLDTIVKQAKAPIARQSIGEKVETFERRINGRILPFLGLHGTVIALIYLIVRTSLMERVAPDDPMVPVWIVLAVALVCGCVTAAFHYLGRAGDVFGGTSLAFSLAILGLLLLPFDTLPAVGAVAVYLVLLLLNASGRVADNEINTVWVYLPFLFLLVGDLSTPLQIASAVALYGPAIYVKFVLQPESNKLALGFSALVFLALIIQENTGSQVLVAVMVLIFLALFAAYAYRMRHATGSSYRHFATDAIVVGLWGVLVGTLFGDAGEDQLIIWGLGVAAYEGLLLLQLLVGKASKADTAAERGARLAWLQLAAVAIFGIAVSETLLNEGLGINADYFAPLLIVAAFIPLFRRLHSPFLALTTRLWIAGCLLVMVADTQQRFEWDYLSPPPEASAAELRANFLSDLDGTLTLAVIALLIGLASTIQAGSIREPAWWRGLVRPRHMVLARRGTRLVVDNANRIAFVGGFISAVVAFFNWVRYAGSDRRGVSSRDVMLVGMHVFAVAMTVLFARYLIACCGESDQELLEANPLTFVAEDWSYVLAFCAWGVLLYLQGLLRRETLARFFASGFVAMPLATYAVNNTAEDSGFLAFVLLSCSFSFFLLGLLRRSTA